MTNRDVEIVTIDDALKISESISEKSQEVRGSCDNMHELYSMLFESHENINDDVCELDIALKDFWDKLKIRDVEQIEINELKKVALKIAVDTLEFYATADSGKT